MNRVHFDFDCRMPRIITHSMAQCFQDCRVKFDYRYNREIVPRASVPALDFGSAVHAGLEFWFKFGVKAGAVEAAIERGARCGLDVGDQIKVRVLLEKYCEVYRTEDFEVLDVEAAFDMPLVNPRTGRASRTFRFDGKSDGLVRKDGKVWILEHKTTSSITDAYIDRIEIDAQIALYAWAWERQGMEVAGAIYDIIEKPGIKWKVGETDEEFEARRAALAAKSKTGKSTAKKQEPDTYDTFLERVRAEVTADSFRRVEVPLTKERMAEAVSHFWATAKDIRDADRTANYYPNSGNCTKFGQVCPYLSLCRAHGDLTQCTDEYRREKAHIELEADHAGPQV